MIDIINDVPFVTLTSKVIMMLLSIWHSFNVTINDLTFFRNALELRLMWLCFFLQGIHLIIYCKMCWLTINVNALLFFYACFFRMNNYLSLYFEVLHQHHVLDTGDWFRWARTHQSNIFKTVAYYTIQLQRNLIGTTCVTPWENISIKKCTKSIVVLDHTVLYWA